MDATIDKKNYKVGLEVLIRNAKGDIVVVAIKSSNFNGEVSFVEAEAIEWGNANGKKCRFINCHF